MQYWAVVFLSVSHMKLSSRRKHSHKLAHLRILRRVLVFKWSHDRQLYGISTDAHTSARAHTQIMTLSYGKDRVIFDGKEHIKPHLKASASECTCTYRRAVCLECKYSRGLLLVCPFFPKRSFISSSFVCLFQPWSSPLVLFCLVRVVCVAAVLPLSLLNVFLCISLDLHEPTTF